MSTKRTGETKLDKTTKETGKMMGFYSLKEKIKNRCLHKEVNYKEVNEELRILLRAVNPEIKLIGWSMNNIGENGVETTLKENATHIEINYQGEIFDFEIPFTDYASIENAVHCAYTGLYLLTEKKSDVKVFFEKFKNFFQNKIIQSSKFPHAFFSCYLTLT